MLSRFLLALSCNNTLNGGCLGRGRKEGEVGKGEEGEERRERGGKYLAYTYVM